MGKLVRDKIPEIIRKSGKEPIVRVMDKEEFLVELKRKAVEEAQEFSEAESKAEMLEELVDELEVILASLEVLDSSLEELQKTRLTKYKERGGFKDRIYWEGNS